MFHVKHLKSNYGDARKKKRNNKRLALKEFKSVTNTLPFVEQDAPRDNVQFEQLTRGFLDGEGTKGNKTKGLELLEKIWDIAQNSDGRLALDAIKLLFDRAYGTSRAISRIDSSLSGEMLGGVFNINLKQLSGSGSEPTQQRLF